MKGGTCEMIFFDDINNQQSADTTNHLTHCSTSIAQYRTRYYWSKTTMESTVSFLDISPNGRTPLGLLISGTISTTSFNKTGMWRLQRRYLYHANQAWGFRNTRLIFFLTSSQHLQVPWPRHMTYGIKSKGPRKRDLVPSLLPSPVPPQKGQAVSPLHHSANISPTQTDTNQGERTGERRIQPDTGLIILCIRFKYL